MCQGISNCISVWSQNTLDTTNYSTVLICYQIIQTAYLTYYPRRLNLSYKNSKIISKVGVPNYLPISSKFSYIFTNIFLLAMYLISCPTGEKNSTKRMKTGRQRKTDFMLQIKQLGLILDLCR